MNWVPRRFNIDDRMKNALENLKDRVQSLVETGESPRIGGSTTIQATPPALRNARYRIDRARNLGLRIDGMGTQTFSELRMLEMCHFLAVEHYDLAYDGPNKCWKLSDKVTTAAGEARRARTFFGRLLEKQGDAAQATDFSYPVIDLVLLWACFGIPFSVAEVEDDEFFDELVECEARRRDTPALGKLLLECDGIDLINAVAETDTELKITIDPEVTNERREALYRQAGLSQDPANRTVDAGSSRGVETVPTGTRLHYQRRIPYRESTQCLLFEVTAANDVYLLSTYWELDEEPEFAKVFVSPRGSEENDEVDERYGMSLGLPENVDSAMCDLLLVMVERNDETSGYDVRNLSFFRETEGLAPGQAPERLRAEQVEELRDALFSLPRRHWKVLRKTIRLERKKQ